MCLRAAVTLDLKVICACFFNQMTKSVLFPKTYFNRSRLFGITCSGSFRFLGSSGEGSLPEIVLSDTSKFVMTLYFLLFDRSVHMLYSEIVWR